MGLGQVAMHFSAVAGLLIGPVAGSAIPEGSTDLLVRALPNAPNGYTPENVSCPPNRPSVRSASSISPSETEWLKKRRPKTLNAMKDFFGHVTISGFDAAGYIKDHTNNPSELPNIGIAVSGGGYRALMNGGGVLSGFDSRTKGATDQGKLGGIVQSATYLSGLSGGGWLVGSLYLNNDTTVTALSTGGEGMAWNFTRSILEGPGDGSVTSILKYYREVEKAVSGKRDAKYPVSITDYWGRTLSYQFIDAPQGGPAYTWSSIASSPDFANGDVAMPILIADGRNPGELLIGGNATVFEFNPYEMGTWDPTIFGFIPTEFLGSAFQAGQLPSSASCVRGFDNAGFVMGTSSSLFNQFSLNLDAVNIPSFIKEELRKILKSIGDENNDIAVYKPNPFFHYSEQSSPFANTDVLDLVDGGEDLQNLPIHPLIQPERSVDVILAVDSSADTEYNWPNGTALVATYQRSLDKKLANGTSFPAIPDQNTFVNLGLNTRPTFFGCDSSNTSSSTPLVVYIPNHPYSAFSNVSTFKFDYSDQQRDSIIQNGFNVGTMGDGSREKEWSTCLACAILSRSLERTKTPVPDPCKDCFKKHCWAGKLDSSKPPPYTPSVLSPSAPPAATPRPMTSGSGNGNGNAGSHVSMSKSGITAGLIAALATSLFW